MSLITAIVAIRRGSGAGGGISLDALLQRFQNGDFTTIRVRGQEDDYPAPEDDPILVTASITGVSVISSTHITLILDVPLASVLIDSPSSQQKYFQFATAGDTEFEHLSLGEPGNDFDAQVEVDETEWIEGDIIDLTNFPLTADTEDIDHIEVTPEDLTPGEGLESSVNCQVKNISDVSLNRIGRQIVPAVVTVSGTGGGDIAESYSWSNVYGEFRPLTYMAGVGGSVERIDVEDQGGFTGSSANINVGVLNAEHSFTVKDSYWATGSSYSRAGITIASGAHMVVLTQAETLGGSNTPTASGLTFTKIGEVDHVTSGLRQSVFAAPCVAGFSGTVNFSGPASGRSGFSAILEDVTSLPVDHITLVALNTVSFENWTGSAPALIEVDYAQTFSDPNNAGAFLLLQYSDIASTPRSGWTEGVDLSNGLLRGVVQYRYGPDTKAVATFASASNYVAALLVELEAVRS